MDIGQVTIKEILTGRLGEEGTTRVLKEINEAYQKGKSGDDLREQFEDAVKKEGFDPDEVNLVVNNVIPNSY